MRRLHASPMTALLVASAISVTFALGWSTAGRSDLGNAKAASIAAVVALAVALAAIVIAAQSARAFGEWLSWGLVALGTKFYAGVEIARLSVLVTSSIVLWHPEVLTWLQATGAALLFGGVVFRTARYEEDDAALAGSFGLVSTAIAASTPFVIGLRLAAAGTPSEWQIAAPVIVLSTAFVATAIAGTVWRIAPDSGMQPFGLMMLAAFLGLSAIAQTLGTWTASPNVLALGRWLAPLAAIGGIAAALSQIRQRNGPLLTDREAVWLEWPPASSRLPVWGTVGLVVAAIATLAVESAIATDLSVLASLSVVLLFGRQTMTLRSERSRVDALQDSAEELQRLANVDRLTGLFSRSALESRLGEEFERAVRHQQPLSLCYVDIDHFKVVNDSFGHHAGDAILRAVAASFRQTARSIDFVGRFGGEEFVVIAPATWSADAMVLAERLRTQVEQLAISSRAGEPVRITVSVGVAGFPEHAADLFTLQDRADQALYRAKSGGRNRSVLYGSAVPD